MNEYDLKLKILPIQINPNSETIGNFGNLPLVNSKYYSAIIDEELAPKYFMVSSDSMSQTELVNLIKYNKEYKRLRQECLESFERFCNFIKVKNKDGIISDYKDYLIEITRRKEEGTL